MGMGLFDFSRFFLAPDSERIPNGSSWNLGARQRGRPDPCRSREDRIARNEDLCRDLNERKARWIERGQLAAGFRCECWNLGCGDRLNLSGRQWEEARSRANRFVVAPGHVVTEFEAVVKEYSHFWLVEKRGEAGDEAEALA
jgi:hypothetical protein